MTAAADANVVRARPRPELMTKRWTPLRPHALQQYIWRNIFKAQFLCLPCGRRSGKTELCKRAGVLRSFEPKPWDDARYGFGAPTYQQAKRIWWSDLNKLIPKQFVDKTSNSELFIRLKSGAEIWVVGMDKPERIEGVGWDGFCMDEYGKMKEGALQENVMPALADRNGWVWTIGVPEGRNHYWKLWNRAKQDPRWLTATWKSNTVLPPHVVEELSAQMDERTAKQEFDASWEAVEGVIYYAFSGDDWPKGNIYTGDMKPPAGIGSGDMPWRVGMDFNVYPMCATLGWEEVRAVPNEDGIVENQVCTHIWKEFKVNDADTEKVSRMIKDTTGSGSVVVYPDPSGRRRQTSAKGSTDHSILKNEGFEVRARFQAPSRRDRYNAVNTRCKRSDGRRTLLINHECEFTLECLAGQAYPDGKNEEDPKDPLGHMNAALGYMIEFEYPIAAIVAQVEGGQF